ncbi:uncharacterized protein C13G5.2-like [Episyrphus balteatus]|uniref:uncharacterized protein C13G5.2-like n=1 Tax=Episyrphus balteatus TaxID=286459 RepID=UPI00248694E9|nr:uncharacterized protein C13G5.2-like [Episyrphus balteatus]
MTSELITKTFDEADKALKCALIFKIIEGTKYTLKISHTKTSAVSILKSLNNGAKPTWLLRFDNAHKNVLFPHLNVRHSLTGIKDPHLRLPPGTLTAVQGGAYAAKVLDWLCCATLLVDGVQLSQAIYKDYKNGTTENTTECAVDKSGQYVGAIVGCTIGKTVGGYLIPGIGPLVGSIGLGIVGIQYGSHLAPKTVAYIKDYYNNWGSKSQKDREEKLNLFLLCANDYLQMNNCLFKHQIPMLRSKL